MEQGGDAAPRQDSTSTTPIFFILSPGADPVKEVEAMGKSLVGLQLGTNYWNVAMGQGQDAGAHTSQCKAHRWSGVEFGRAGGLRGRLDRSVMQAGGAGSAGGAGGAGGRSNRSARQVSRPCSCSVAHAGVRGRHKVEVLERGGPTSSVGTAPASLFCLAIVPGPPFGARPMEACEQNMLEIQILR